MYDKNDSEDLNDIHEPTTAETEPEPSLDEVAWAIKNLKNGKSPGCDEIPAELIKAGGEESIHVYHALCQKIWKYGIWPKDWKRTIFIPIPKKGNLKLCTNYRTVALISHASKILLKIIMGRLRKKMEEEINIVQAGFRQGRGTRDHILNMRLIIEKCREFNVNLFSCFVDYSKAFDCVQHQKLWEIMGNMGFPSHIVQLIKMLYLDQQAAVRIDGETSDWFNIKQGVRQGCVLSPYLFNLYAEDIMRNVRDDIIRDQYDALNIGGHEIPEIRYADDTVLLSTSQNGIENLLTSTQRNSENHNLYLNIAKTKIMHIDKTTMEREIYVNEERLEVVENFEYLGSLITNNGDTLKEIKRRLSIALQRLKQLNKLWNGTDRTTKIRFLRACIFPIATYACETWTLTKQAEQRINAFEYKCYRRVLRISWVKKRTNASILQELNIEEGWLLKTIKRRKLIYFGHLKRHESLERTIMEGYMPGKRGRGRPKRRWVQDVADDLQMDVSDAGHLACDRDVFRKVVMAARFCNEQATE